MAFMDRFKGRKSYADRLRTTNVARGMVAPQRTPYQHQLDELAERLNPSDKVMRTSRAADIYEPIKVLGDPVSQEMGPGRLLPDPARSPRLRAAEPASGVSNIRTSSGQGFIEGIGPSRSVRQRRAVGGLEGRGVRPAPGSRSVRQARRDRRYP